MEKIADLAIAAPVCVDGARACPPEDSGGSWGYTEKLEALADPEGDEEQDYLREWMGDFDPEQFDVDSVNKELKRVFGPVRRKRTRSVRNQ